MSLWNEKSTVLTGTKFQNYVDKNDEKQDATKNEMMIMMIAGHVVPG